MFFSLENAPRCFPTFLLIFIMCFPNIGESARITLRYIYSFSTQGQINIGLTRHVEPEPYIFQGLRSSYYFAILIKITHNRKFLVENISNNSCIRADYRMLNLSAEPLT